MILMLMVVVIMLLFMMLLLLMMRLMLMMTITMVVVVVVKQTNKHKIADPSTIPDFTRLFEFIWCQSFIGHLLRKHPISQQCGILHECTVGNPE